MPCFGMTMERSVCKSKHIAAGRSSTFFAPYPIVRGNFYIHNALFFGERSISPSEIELIRTNYIRGLKMSGRKYILHGKKTRQDNNGYFGQNQEE